MEKTTIYYFSTFLLLALSAICSRTEPLEETYSWTRLHYRNVNVFRPENPEVPPNDPTEDSYIYEHNVPFGVNVWHNKLFVTVPRRAFGIPSTLNYIPLDTKPKLNPALIPYPNWEQNRLQCDEKDRIVSVYRTAIDACDRLWIVDTGTIEAPAQRVQLQSSRLIAFDLRTGRVILRRELPHDLIFSTTSIVNLVIDLEDENRCSDAYVYMPDIFGYSVLVYSLAADRFWRCQHSFFHLEPLESEYRVAGFRFQWRDGVFSLAVDGPTVYFHPFSGINLYSVPVAVFRNESLATRSYHGDDFRLVVHRRKWSQTAKSELHRKSGAMFLSYPNHNGVAYWRIGSGDKFPLVQTNNRTMIYPCDLRVNDDDLYVLTNNLPTYLYGRLNYDEVNFRIWIGNVWDAIKDAEHGNYDNNDYKNQDSKDDCYCRTH